MLLITIAFLRFYDQTDFEFLGLVANPRQWSNGFTVAALLATLANFGVEWNRRNRETNRLAQEAQRRVEEGQRRMAQERADESRRAEERERQIARTRIETRCRIAEIQFQLDPSDRNRRLLREALALLAEYGDLFS
ncbi:slr0978 [Synechocystis sp. PCC 6803]|uniref:Slr0978 protein n=1 Tax=Synechocystis sp. (strain ATCC 27184 / PCC 6803 / Kazusa) TaxID=1111708 RepID=P72881_SYNY3|nr:hypothetical protein MYO_13250 [Synechocystis sp. PCC 6803]AVP88506.1 hypothetical protein C7I86_01670 [Synechocystis sp. IPPAS B-1465]BAL28068.1 hypothetical protein SYNGTI_0321 [Synechocystis sp. PCC 6803 substr. GT-I]BAL31238.1 hypothetical protein SYNPCCN_0321 [Synechocystis sp. PCC 6803 substr. PCC-N]BAL34407.1 hypothetical protein SYNPCCP_0321 [Synechocystis sp. PCC 6803 substr. PCC-P]BAM50608.1 hypothetical protein BEST7613_1677 [Synechocystis sp. PCC 6803] [Bacillus subtilis BEST761